MKVLHKISSQIRRNSDISMVRSHTAKLVHVVHNANTWRKHKRLLSYSQSVTYVYIRVIAVVGFGTSPESIANIVSLCVYKDKLRQ